MRKGGKQKQSNLEKEVERLRRAIAYQNETIKSLTFQKDDFLRILKFYEAQFETARKMLSVVPIPVNYGNKIPDVNLGPRKENQ